MTVETNLVQFHTKQWTFLHETVFLEYISGNIDRCNDQQYTMQADKISQIEHFLGVVILKII